MSPQPACASRCCWQLHLQKKWGLALPSLIPHDLRRAGGPRRRHAPRSRFPVLRRQRAARTHRGFLGREALQWEKSGGRICYAGSLYWNTGRIVKDMLVAGLVKATRKRGKKKTFDDIFDGPFVGKGLKRKFGDAIHRAVAVGRCAVLGS